MLSPKRILRSGSIPLSGVSPQRLTPWLNLMLVAMLAWTLAQLTWRLVPMDDAVRPAGSLVVMNTSVAETSTQSRMASLEHVAALHLFGNAEEAPAEVEQAPITAPETRLNLKLRGLIALDAQEAALAIIAKGESDEQAYGVGDTVPGGAVLHEIHADRVILKRSGRFETLTLPKERMDVGAGANISPAVPSVSRSVGLQKPPGVTVERLQAVRESIIKDPQKAMQLINAQPVMDGGQLKGYRVNPGRDRRLFNSVGLRPGDIVTSVNGIPLSDPTQMGRLFEQMSSANRLNVTVERGGQQSQLSLDLE